MNGSFQLISFTLKVRSEDVLAWCLKVWERSCDKMAADVVWAAPIVIILPFPALEWVATHRKESHKDQTSG
jgi:hypothetical protein